MFHRAGGSRTTLREFITAGLALGVSAGALVAPEPSHAVACGAGTVSVTRVSGPVLYLQSGTSPALDSAYAMYRVTNTSGSAVPDLWVRIGSFGGPKIGLAPSESGLAHPGALSAGAATNAAFYLRASGENLTPETHTVRVYSTRPDLAGGPLCEANFTMTAEEDIAASANKVTSVSSSAAPQLGGRLTITVVGDTGTIGAAGRFTATPASYATWPSNAYRLIGSKVTMSRGNTGVFTDTLYFSGLNPSATDYSAEFTFAVVGTTATSTAVSPMTHISSGTQVKHTSTSNFGTLPAIPAVVSNTTLTMAGTPSSLPDTGGTATYMATVTNAGSATTTLDDITVDLPATTTYVPGSATFAGSATADPAVSGTTATFLTALSVPAGASRELSLQVTVPAVAGPYQATATGHITGVAIDTTAGTTDNQPAVASVTVAGAQPPAPSPANLTSTGVGPAAQTATVTVPSGGSATLLDAGGNPAAGSVTIPGQGSYALSGSTITFTPVLGFAGTASPVGYQVTDHYQQTGTAIYTPTVTPPAAPEPPDRTSTGVGTAAQITGIVIPAGGSATLLSGGNPTAGPVTVPGQGSYALSGSTITFTPALGFTGSVGTGYRVTDAYGQHSDATYTATVTPPAPPVAPDRATQGVGTTPQAAVLPVPAGGTIALLDADGESVTTLVVAGKGTYRLTLLNANAAALTAAGVDGATITFVPVLGYKGKAPAVHYVVTDPYGQTATATYTPTVTLPPLAEPPPKQSTGEKTDPQHVTLPVPAGGSVALLDPDGDPVTSLTVAGQGTYTLDPATGDLTFTPVAGFTGTPDPITYRVTDAYGQTATATYTPAVIGEPQATASPALPITGMPISTLVLVGWVLIASGAAVAAAAGRSGVGSRVTAERGRAAFRRVRPRCARAGSRRTCRRR